MNNQKQRNKDLPFADTHICAICGDEFPVTRRQGQKIYCDNCKPKHVKQWRKKHYLEYYYGPNREKILSRGNEWAKNHSIAWRISWSIDINIPTPPIYVSELIM